MPCMPAKRGKLLSLTFVSALLPPHLCLLLQLQWHAHGSPSLQPTEAERTACLGFAFADVHDSLLLSPHNVVAELYRWAIPQHN